jgi:uncharacterized protein YuzE
MKINYDKMADAIYLNVSKGKIKKSIRMNDRLVVDVSNNGKIIGVEFLDASARQIKDLEKNLKNGVPINVAPALSVAC